MENSISFFDCQYQALGHHWDNVTFIGNYWRFYWNEGNGAYILYRDQQIELVPENYYLVPPLFQFSTRNVLNPHQFYYHFALPQYKASPQLGPQTFPLSNAIRAAISRIQSELLPPPAFFTSKGFFSLMGLTGMVLRDLEDHHSLVKVYDEILEGAIAYIHRHLEQPLRAKDLARQIHMGRSRFFVEFKAYTGLSPNQFIHTIKMEAARHKLRHTQLSIDEIASSLGYTDRFHFSKTFKRRFGVSPGRYR